MSHFSNKIRTALAITSGAAAMAACSSAPPQSAHVQSQASQCELPTSFNWVSTPPVVGPNHPDWASVKDPSIVRYNDKYHVYATTYNEGWKSIYFNFSDWDTADSAAQVPMESTRVGNTVAPQIFYFRPHNKWYNITQWGGSYATTDNIEDPSSWSEKKPLLEGEPKGSLDFWVICDDSDCSLFFSRDDGVLYRSKTSIENFPNFSGYEIVMEDHRGNGNSFLFEAANVYKVDGHNQYLLLVEAYHTPGYGPRYFRSWTSASLDGPWQPLADTEENPFAGEANVEWPEGKWSRGISHGELVRSGFDERLTIDPCNLEFLYQGEAGPSPGSYGEIPYRLGVLRQK